MQVFKQPRDEHEIRACKSQKNGSHPAVKIAPEIDVKNLKVPEKAKLLGVPLRVGLFALRRLARLIPPFRYASLWNACGGATIPNAMQAKLLNLLTINFNFCILVYMNETIHEKLAKIFQDTQAKYSTNPVLKNACENTRKNEKLYLADNKIEDDKMEEKLDFDKNRFDEKAKIIVSKKRTFEAAEPYAKSGLKTAVLNFANAFHPGGGVVNGAGAQEECLCRCSTLYDSLVSPFMIENFYKKHRATLDNLANDDLIFSPSVKVFKSDVRFPEILPENEWFDVDVITCAAPNIRVGWNGVLDISDEKLSALHESRLRKILDAALANKDDAVILGAFGCGAFKNPPKVVAATTKKVILDYERAFKTIEFAVFCPPQDSTNFDVFNEILGK